MAVLKVKKKENPFIYYNNCDDYNEETFTLKSKIGPDLVADSDLGDLVDSSIFSDKKSFKLNKCGTYNTEEFKINEPTYTFECYFNRYHNVRYQYSVGYISLDNIVRFEMYYFDGVYRIHVLQGLATMSTANAIQLVSNSSTYCLYKFKSKYNSSPAHFAAVITNDEIKVFCDGELVLSGTFRTPLPTEMTTRCSMQSDVYFTAEFISLRKGDFSNNGESFPVPSATYLADTELADTEASSIITMRATDTVDIGGRNYRVVNMPDGNTWLAENLDYKIPGIPIDISGSPSTPSAWYYNKDESTYGLSGTYKCGLLYNWYAVKLLNDNKDTLIPGWHVPTKEEWETLTSSIQSVNGSEFKAKDYSITSNFPRYWNGKDDYGFSVIPAGSYNSSFGHFGDDADFWTLNQDDNDGAFRYYFRSSMYGYDGRTMISGYSLRLVKDTPMKIYKTNRVIISYTPKYGSVLIGGRKYKTVRTPDGKTWLAENLDLKWDGLVISDDDSTSECMATYYNNDESTFGVNGKNYGLLYNYKAACFLDENKDTYFPGWHIVTENDYNSLLSYYNNDKVAICKDVKSKLDWEPPGLDTTGLNMLPSGYAGSYNNFYGINKKACFWVPTKKYGVSLAYMLELDNYFGLTTLRKDSHASIRLVKDS